MNIDIPGYVASPWQQEFHNLPHDEALGGGAAGPGKTFCLIFEPFAQIFVEHQRCTDKNHPYHISWGDSVGWALHLKRTLKTLKQSIEKTIRLFPKIDPGAKWSPLDNMWTFSSGYKYQFGHCNEKNSWMDYMGLELTIICFDELVAFEQEQYEQIRTRCRTADPVLRKMKKVRAMSNPVMTVEAGDQWSVTNPHWVRDYFVAPAREGRETIVKEVKMDDGSVERRTRIFLPARLHDNPVKQFVRDYEIQLQGERPHIRRALLYGDWYVVPGGFYSDDWNPQLHVCKPFAIPPDWPVFRSMDWGYKAPGCVHWYAMDGEGNLFVFRELTFRGKTDAEVAKMIKDVEAPLKLWSGKRSLITGPADWQLWEERGDSGKTKAQVMAEAGVTWVPCEKTTKTNAGRLLDRLKDHDNGTATPGIVFFNTCVKAIETIPMIQTDKDDVERPLDGGPDHWHDSVLYGCAYASRGRAGLGRARRMNLDRPDDDDERPKVRRGPFYGEYN